MQLMLLKVKFKVRACGVVGDNITNIATFCSINKRIRQKWDHHEG